MKKVYPQVGDKLYLSQRTGSYYIDMVKRPYTVVGVNTNYIMVRECKLIFNGPRYFDTLADKIEDDPNGEVIKLSWAPSKGRWQYNTVHHAGYPEYAYFGEWKYQPYLD